MHLRRATSTISVITLGLLLASSLPADVTTDVPERAPSEGKLDLPVHDGVGGDFAARSSLGRVVESSEFRGDVVLVFFGYTSCQDICPATLSHLAALFDRLGPAADDVRVLLVTVDPENDTESHLKQYLARFDDRFIGLTGSQEEIDQIASMFMVKHDKSHGMEVTTAHNRSKAFTESAFLYSHSQQVYLLDKSGRTRGLLYVGSPLEEMQTAVLALLAE
jgi:protein SCO1/2